MKKSHIKKMIKAKREKEQLDLKEQEKYKVIKDRYNERCVNDTPKPRDLFLDIFTSGLTLGG